MKGILGIVLFVFFLIIFILMLTGGFLIRAFKKALKNAQDAADKKEQRFRDEVGRQRRQYSQRQQPQNARSSQNAQDTPGNQSNQDSQSTESFQQPQNDNARRTETATGETIIDHHHENRENKKIFDDEEGEYVEFTEEA